MRTLQEKYNGIQEGKFSEENFLADARRELPNLITRFNGYDDAIQILKNKGMVVEAKVDTETLKDVLRGGKKIATGVRFLNAKDYKDGNKVSTLEKGDQVLDSKETVKEARLTKNNLTDYRYKPTNEMDKYPYEQILRGIRVELEVAEVFGTPTAEEYAKALAKVSKNLAKDSIFYTNQLAGVNTKVDLHDKMVDATAKNTVDTFNGMKKAQLKEGFKKLIKKVLSENTDEEVYEMYGEDDIDYDDENFSDPLIDGEEDDIPFPRGYEEASDEEDQEGDPGYKGYESPSDRMYNSDAWVQAQRDMMEGNKSEKELRAEWENHQATSHPEDKMSYIEWRSEQGLDEAIDTEADKNMVRKFMKMYETDPAKFERLHKQAQTQAATNKDIKYKHLLSLLNRAKAGSVQPKEIPGFEGTRDALDNLFESVSLFDILDENYETDPYNLNDKTDYRKMGAKAFYDNKKRNQNPYSLDSPAGIDWDKGWDKAQSAESDSYKGY
jgi:hypothetical protein